MSKIKNRIINLFRSFINYLRGKYYLMAKKRKLKNFTPTIIASDCFDTFVSHNLGLQYRSPTVNLYFTKNDFIEFVRNLNGYLEAGLTEYEDESVSFPVGQLLYNGTRIRIFFMHYRDFESAKQKWEERKKRISFDNLFITQVIPKATEEDINTFDSLPYENKMLVTSHNLTGSPNVVEHPMLGEENYVAGKFLKYTSMFSIRRPMDKIDYVSFLNRNVPD